MKNELPLGWEIETRYVGGTGYGDEHYRLVLIRREERVTGRLWWKKTREVWVVALSGPVFFVYERGRAALTGYAHRAAARELHKNGGGVIL